MLKNLSMPSLYKCTILGLIFIMPFIFVPYIPHPYEYPKFVLLIGGSFLLSFYSVFLYLKKNSTTYAFDLTDKLLCVFLLWLFLVDCIGLDPKVSLLGGEYRFQGFVAYLALIIVYFLIKSIKISKKALYKCTFVSVFMLSLITIVSFFLLHLGSFVPNFQGRVIGTMGNPNSLGIHLVLLLSLALFGHNETNRVHTITDVLISICVGIAVVFTDSRSALIGFVFVLVCKLLQVIYGKCGRKVLILAIGFVVLGLSLATFLYSLSVQKRMSQWDNRPQVWRYGIKSVAVRPIFGYGQENFELIFPRELKLKVDNAHNYLLELGVAGGLPLVILFLTICFSALRQNRHLYLKIFVATFLIVSFFNPVSLTSLLLLWGVLGQFEG